MDIKKYYATMSKIYLNQMIMISLAFSGSCIILSSFQVNKLIPYMMAVVWLFIAVFFVKYLYYKGKNRQIKLDSIKPYKENEVDQQYMIEFLPSSSFYAQFYTSNGICSWEIKGAHKKRKGKTTIDHYLLQNKAQMKRILIKITHHNRPKLTVSCSSFHKMFYLARNNRRKIVFQSKKDDMVVQKSHNEEIECVYNGKMIARVRRGFMPVKWQQIFSPNTPILSFEHNVNDEEKILTTAFLVYFYLYKV